MSLFMYNQDGQQARAAVSLTAAAVAAASRVPLAVDAKAIQ
jgi:hypothetical protein